MASKITCSSSIALVLVSFLMVVEFSSCRKPNLLDDANAALVTSQDSILPSSAIVGWSDDDFIDYESGISVETVLDGNKLNMSIHETVAVPSQDYVYAIDSSGSQLLKIQLPIDQSGSSKGVARRVAGDGRGRSGHRDGWGEEALLDHPKGITVDGEGNVYIADVRNRVVRKVTPSGYVSTIAGQSNKTGHADGEGRNACFSANFDLTYLPRLCSLLVSDRGNRRLRMIQLQPREKCNPDEAADSGHLNIWSIPFSITVVILSTAAVAKVQCQKWELQRKVLALGGGNGIHFNGPMNGHGGSNVLTPDQAVMTRPLLADSERPLQRGRILPEGVTHISSLSAPDLMDFADLPSREREQSRRQHCLGASVTDRSGDAEDDVLGRLQSVEREDDNPATPGILRLRSVDSHLLSDSDSILTNPSESSAGSPLFLPDRRISIDEEIKKSLQQFSAISG